MSLNTIPTPHYLSTRPNWEAGASAAGGSLERATADAIRSYLNRVAPGQFRVDTHPTDLAQLYLEEDYKHHPDDYVKSATPMKGDIYWNEEQKAFLKFTGKVWKVEKNGGCIPDIKVTHIASGRRYYIECKNQGDEGNAQERACKYATPSVLAAIKERAGVDYHPVGYLFSGELVKSKKYIRELRLSFSFAAEHLFLWDPMRPLDVLEAWVERVIRPRLEGITARG